MPALIDLLLEGRRIHPHGPWPRAVVSPAIWSFAAGQLAEGRWTLLGLWGEKTAVHMALLNEPTNDIGVVTLECPSGRYPSIGQRHLPALRLERTIRDLFGLEPENLPDTRPWLDHGRWGVRFPMGSRAEAPPKTAPYAFLAANGESLHQIPVGPVHAGIIEPGHFRFTANGEAVVRLEERLGYVHKGIEELMSGASLEKAARLACRVSGDSMAAYGLAFARAVEAALGIEAPPRAAWLRALMAELERMANHLGDIGAVCNDAAFSLMHAHCGVLRERVLRATDACFGHRLMCDCIVPGGVAIDLALEGTAVLRALIAEIKEYLPVLIELFDNTASLKDRAFDTGILNPALVRQYGTGGFVGRASGRAFDARRQPGYPPYDDLNFNIPVLEAGDVNARVWIRFQEVEQSLSLVTQILDRLPAGPIRVETPLARDPREGMAIIEGFRGDILVWLRLSGDGKVDRCHLRDPSWFQWPLLEAAIEGNIVADFPLCNKSFNCSYSGHDL